MILVLDLCSTEGNLHRREFVKPVTDILAREDVEFEVKRYEEVGEIEADGIIICGVALMDNGFVDDVSKFDWLDEVDVPVLGICAGMQVMLQRDGWERIKSLEVGKLSLTEVPKDPVVGLPPDTEVYCLHSWGMQEKVGEWDVLGRSVDAVQMVKHKDKPRWGVLFHPEVLNKDIIDRFGKFCRLK